MAEFDTRKADALRDAKKWAEAASAYWQVLQLHPKKAGIWVQLGHARKETGDHAGAEEAYLRSVSLEPAVADTFLQLGHLEKIRGNLRQAAVYYQRSIDLDKTLRDADRELAALRLKGIIPPVDRVGYPIPERSKHSAKSQPSARVNDSDKVDVTIVGKIGTTNGIALHTHAFLKCLANTPLDIQTIDTRPAESEKNIKRQVTVPVYDTTDEAKNSYVSVYCDVIANSETDRNTYKIPESVIKLAYAVFDSSRIPSFWIERLNKFDGIAVPDQFVLNILKRSGVYRPVFVLPLALDYSLFDHYDNEYEIETADAEYREPFTFGCVAGFGERKNIDGLISAFHEAFGNSPDVCLRIHSTLNFSNYYENVVKRLQDEKIDNVVPSCSSLSDRRYAKLFENFDAYVNASKGEGFSITPRQALYLGKPTIISDNSAHESIVSSGLVIGVPTARYEKAFFEGLGGIECGYQCVPDHKILVDSLRKVYREHSKLSSKKSEMRTYALSFGIEELHERYSSLVSPKSIFLDPVNVIGNSYLATADVSLYNKFADWEAARRRRVPVRDRQRISVVGHDGGFFSVFNTYLSHLVWNQGRLEITSIVPDWRVGRIKEHRVLEKFQSFCYGSRTDGNLWLKFFYPVSGMEVSESDYNDPDFLENAVIYDDFNEHNEPNLTYIHAYNLYRDPEFTSWRKLYNLFLKKHIRFRDHLLAEVDTFKANHFQSGFIIGCHVRHPSHKIEQPGRSMPTVELYQRLVIDRAVGLKNWKVFLATDQESVIDSFKELFGSRLIHRGDVARVTVEHDRAFNALTSTEQNQEGHQIQHLTASDEAKWSTKMGDEVIIDTLLLSACDTFIHVTSNIATAVSFLNPDVEMIYCE